MSSYAAAASQGIQTIAQAYQSYEAGRMKQMAFNHKAAMAELNAKQVGINAQFEMNDRINELRKTLALQNAISGATGRSGGSVEALAQTSIANMKRDEQRIMKTAELKKVAELMDVESLRAAGKSAKRAGILEGINQLISGGQQSASFLGGSSGASSSGAVQSGANVGATVGMMA